MGNRWVQESGIDSWSDIETESGRYDNPLTVWGSALLHARMCVADIALATFPQPTQEVTLVSSFQAELLPVSPLQSLF